MEKEEKFKKKKGVREWYRKRTAELNGVKIQGTNGLDWGGGEEE